MEVGSRRKNHLPCIGFSVTIDSPATDCSIRNDEPMTVQLRIFCRPFDDGWKGSFTRIENMKINNHHAIQNLQHPGQAPSFCANYNFICINYIYVMAMQ